MRVEEQLAADPVFGLVQRHLVLLQVLVHPLERLGRFLVVAERLRPCRTAALAEAVADVAQVAQRARQVAFQDVAVQVFELAAADGLDEVAEVVSSPPPANFATTLPSLS